MWMGTGGVADTTCYTKYYTIHWPLIGRRREGRGEAKPLPLRTSMTDSTDPAASSSSGGRGRARARSPPQTTRQSALGAPPRRQLPASRSVTSRPLPSARACAPRTRLQPKARSSRNGRALRAVGVAHPLAEMSMPPDAGEPRSTGRRGAQPRSASRFAASCPQRSAFCGASIPATAARRTRTASSPAFGAKRSPRRFFPTFTLLQNGVRRHRHMVGGGSGPST